MHFLYSLHFTIDPRILSFDRIKVSSSNMTCSEADADFFRLLMKGVFNPCVLRPFDKKLTF